MREPRLSPSSPRAHGFRIAALMAFAAGVALVAAPAIAKRPNVTRNRGFSAEDARVYGARGKKQKKRRERKGKKARKKRKEAPVPKAACTIGTEDLIRQPIHASARTSLMRKMSGSETTRAEASSIYRAIVGGTLAGISLEPPKASTPRQRVLPPGALSACLTHTDGKPPTIVVREKLNKDQIDTAISSAWKACGLPTTHACRYESPLKRPSSRAQQRTEP